MEFVFILEVKSVPVPTLALLPFVRMVEPTVFRAFPHRLLMLYIRQEYYDMVVEWLRSERDVIGFELVYPLVEAIRLNEVLPEAPL